MNYFKNRFIIILAGFILMLGVLAGCGDSDSPDNGDNGDVGAPDNGETGDPVNGDNGNGEQGDPIDFSSLYTSERAGFKDGQYIRYDLWQKVDGVESTAWFSMEVSESDGIYTVKYAAEFKNREWGGQIQDFEFSGEAILPPDDSPFHQFEEGRFHYQFRDHISQNTTGNFSKLLDEAIIPVLENFEGMGLEYVGDIGGVDNYEIEVPGYKTFAGQEGYHMTLKMDGQLIYELCISPDFPLNLYSYNYDVNGDEYRAELVEYRD